MVRRCCVTNCNGNYNPENKVKTFRLPRNIEEKERWRKIIPRDNLPDNKNTVVCERHWPQNYPTILDYGKLRPKDPPSVFECVKPSLVPTIPPAPRNSSKTLCENRNKKEDELAAFDKQDKLENIDILKDKVKAANFGKVEIVSYMCNNKFIIQSSDFLDGSSVPRFSMCISDDLTYESFHYGIKCIIKTLSKLKVYRLNRFSHIQEALRYLDCSEMTQKKEVLHQQIQSMSVTYVGEKKYTTETLVRAFEYFALSRATYNRFRTSYQLPSTRTLTRLTSKVKSIDDNTYIKHIFANISDERQKNCILLLDEVYVKASLQYHGGIVFGKAVNNPNLLANTVLSFMIVSLFGGPKFLCRMLPVRGLDAHFVYEQANLILDAIKCAGGNTVAIICDANRVNQKFYTMFDRDYPWRTKDNIFLLFDYVHLFKNIRNNWITEQCQEIEFYSGDQKKVAKWADIIELYELESNKDKLATMSSLTEVAVYPKPIERQKVSTYLQVFCDETLPALRVHPKLKNNEGTIGFLSYFIDFWKIVNVHSPYSNIRMRDPDRAAITSPNDESLNKLLLVSRFAEEQAKYNGKRFKSLTKDTANCLYQTCNGMVELSKYLLSSSHQYVLLGCFTSDPLEKEFGKLRQGSGGTYFINVQQVLEKVSIYKTKLMLKIDTDVIETLKNLDCGHTCKKCGYLPNEAVCDMLENLPELERYLDIDTKMSLVYISGYICRQDDDNDDDTYFIYEKFGDFVRDINRGGLKIPGDMICQWTIYSYIIFHEVVKETCRTSLCNLLMMIAEYYGLNINKKHGRIMANILFKNYCVLYSPHSDREPNQKVLKLSTS